MTDICLYPFEPEHMARIQPGPDNALEYGRSVFQAGPAFSAFAGEQIIGCAGIGIGWPGVAEGWMVLDKSAEQYKKAVFKLAQKGIRQMFDAYSLHRLQATCGVDAGLSWKWLEALGFKREGTMRGYWTDKSDHYRYAIVRV